MRFLGAILGLFLAAPACGQMESINMDGFCGIFDSIESVAIPKCASPSALDVETDETGRVLVKRDGTASVVEVNATASSLTSMFIFKNQSGNEIILVADSTGTVYRSTNWTAPVQITTITAEARLFCSENDGTAYCFTSENDPQMIYDGVTFSTHASYDYPKGKSNAFTQTRHLVIGSTNNPNRLYVSKAADWDYFTVGNDEVDAFFEDIGRNGDKLTGVLPLNDKVILFKEYSVGGVILEDQFNFEMYSISDRVGIQNPEAVVIRGGRAYFKGSDNDFYVIDGTPGGIDRLSGNIRKTVGALLTGSNFSSILTNRTDWDAGDLDYSGPGALVRTDIIIGSVMPSSATFVQTDADDFSAGSLTQVSTHTITGSIVLSSTVVEDNWADNDTTDAPTWTAEVGSVFAPYGEMYGQVNGDSLATTPSTIATGAWDWSWRWDGTYDRCFGLTAFTCFEARFLISGGEDYYGILQKAADASGGVVQIYKYKDGSGTVLTSSSVSHAKLSTYDYHVTRGEDGVIDLFIDDVWISSTTDTDISSAVKTGFNLSAMYAAQTTYNFIDNFKAYQYYSSGTYISAWFDTGISTPVSGPFQSTFTYSDGENGVAFYTRFRSGSSDTPTAWVSSSDTVRLPVMNEQEWQSKAEFWTGISTKTPELKEVSLPAQTTAQYITGPLQTGATNISWGAANLTMLLSGNASFYLSITTGASSSDLNLSQDQNWVDISSGSDISIATAPVVAFKIACYVASSTETCRLDSLTLSWSEDEPAPASYAAAWGGDLFFAVSDSGGGNNKLLKYEPDRGFWWVHRLGMNSPTIWEDSFYFCSTHTAKILRYSARNPDDATHSDDGSDISATWTSRELSGADPFSESYWRRLSAVMKAGSGDVTISWQTETGISGSFDVQLSTGDTFVRHNEYLPAGTLGTFFNFTVTDSSPNPFKIYGIRVDHEQQEWRTMP